ncbi:MAG: iron-containing alcohol dehydrogenase, partial [Anaerolineales bacterium]
MNLYLYGPPGSGKSTVGRYVAQHTGFGFVDLDILIETLAGKSIPEIFESEGEVGFRRLEKTALGKVTCCHNQVVALGGGALLDNENRKAVENSGIVFCLQAETQTLARRLHNDETQRPLLAEDQQNKLEQLLLKRKEHYASFRNQIVTDQKSVANIAWEIQTQAGLFLVEGMGLPYEVRVEKNSIERVGEILTQKGFRGQLFVLTDENVARYYLPTLEKQLTLTGFRVSTLVLPPGEQTKNMDTVQKIWTHMVEQGMDRSSTVIALGGGVVSDIGGFVSATYMRGIPWIVLPTTLLAMA